MAIYHLSMGQVSRSAGRSAVQAAAYITRTCLQETRRGITADYRSKDDEVFWETLAPEGSGIDKKDLEIWNRLENFEDEYGVKRYKNLEAREKFINSAQVAHTYVFALPKELSQEQNIDLIREIVQERFVSIGLIATYSIHWEEGNPHVHINASHRAVEGNIEEGGTFSFLKVARPLCARSGLRETRKFFADKTNALFESLGMEARIDHRSYAERGIDLIPTQHKGWMAHQLERDGLISRIIKDNEFIVEENKERIAQEPGIILKELTSKQATFSEHQVVSLVQKRLKDDMGVLGEHVIDAALKEAVEVGKDIHGFKRYTSQEYFDKEAKVLESFEAYQDKKAAISIDPAKVEALLKSLEEDDRKDAIRPNEGQQNGIRVLCGDQQLSIMIGRAGTGKTTTMQSVIKLHEDAGYTVLGMAPSATAASQLEEDTGCNSDTIAHYAYYWKMYHEAVENLNDATTNKERRAAQQEVDKYSKHLPDEKTLILIDEAGMVGVGGWNDSVPGGWDALVKTINLTGSKLILVGDDHQFKPVEAGDIFRKLIEYVKEKGSLCELNDIMRQNIPWMREASKHLAELNSGTALEMYEHQGHVQEHATNVDVYEDMARQYLRNTMRVPDSQGIVLAATNVECQNLNREIRSMLKANGLLSEEDLLNRGEDGYAIGDKIVFTKNDRGFKTSFESNKKNFFVRNNAVAVIQSITPVRNVDQETGEITQTYKIVAEMPGIAMISFNLSDYSHFAHGYAVTGIKSQGRSPNWTLLKASKFMDAHAFYVGLTRHRDDITIYYSNEDFPNFWTFVKSIGKIFTKDLVVDYSVLDENQEFWDNVQDYKEIGQELAAIGALARRSEKSEQPEIWADYKKVQVERKQLAKIILNDREFHKDFVRQVGLTFESIEIVAGLRKRALCRAEVQAQLVVEQYAAASLEARELWRDIRRTHPGTRAKTHPEWLKFEEARDLRGVLANQIYQNPILHGPFLKETAKQLENQVGYPHQKISYGMGTIKVQAEAHQSKMLQEEILRDDSESAKHTMLKTLLDYVEARDQSGAIWKEIRPKLKEFEGTLLKESFSKAITEWTEVRIVRDAMASHIMENREDFEVLAIKVGIKLDFENLSEQAIQATRDRLIKTYQTSQEETILLQAAFELNSLMKSEAGLDKKPTISQVYQHGLQPKAIAEHAVEFQKMKLFETLKTEPEQKLFLLLDEYDVKCHKANQLYTHCIDETKDKGQRAWESTNYPAYKTACVSRNDLALEIFDQRDHGQVLAMAESMGMKFKEVELQEIFSRCEQATRTRHIISYQKAEDLETKGQAAVAITQLIAFERKEGQGASITAQQAYHAGINFKELQETTFAYGRMYALKSLSTEHEINLFHTLEDYEKAARAAKGMYKVCIEESKARTTKEVEVKPWETDKFREYIFLVTIQDEHAHQLIKGFDTASLTKIAKEMGISCKNIDVDAHRHVLRQTLQTFMDDSPTKVAMAAGELLNWLEFDHHSDYKHTFKILREKDLWPKDIQKSLEEFYDKKRTLRHETQRNIKQSARAGGQSSASLNTEYKVITYERHQSFEEVDKQLKERMHELATVLLGNPTSRTSNQLRFGRKGSICVFTGGAKQGLYANHESGIYGGPLKLIEDQVGLSIAKDSLKWATDWLGGNPLVIEQRVVENQKNTKTSTWTPIMPVPTHAENPDIAGNKYLNFYLRDGGKEVSRHAYRDEQGNLKGYVFRFEKSNGDKIDKFTPPLAYCENEKGFRAWKWQGFDKENKTPYGIEKLIQDPNKPILVVEGEKTTDTAQKLLPEYHVLTWGGGAGNVGKTNWESLIGKTVVIWPDHDYDQGGQNAAKKLQQTLIQFNENAGKEGSVGIVNLPPYLPNKWDLADELPKGWTLDTVKEMIKAAEPQKKLEIFQEQKEKLNKPDFSFKRIENRIKELKLNEKLIEPQHGIEKLVEEVYNSLTALNHAYRPNHDVEKLLDHSIYIALRIQYASILNELEEHNFLQKICLEAKLFFINPNAHMSSIVKTANIRVKELLEPLKNSHEKEQKMAYHGDNSQSLAYYKKLLGGKAQISEENIHHAHQFENTMKAEISVYKTHQQNIEKQLMQNRQKDRSFEHEL
jgi:ATP-dependent exoDNAse (exonuclease V) alpha subunit